MISVILFILKILGISLLVILGMLILMICLVLFVPVRYRFDGSYQNNQVVVSSHVTWLLHLISAKIHMKYDKAFYLHIVVRLLGIPIFDNQKKAADEEIAKKNKKRKKKKNKRDEDIPPDSTDTEIQAASTNEAEYLPDIKEYDSSPIPDFEDEQDIMQELTETESSDQEDQAKSDEKTLFEKIYILLEKLIQFIQNIQYTFHKLYDTMVKIRDNINYYLDILQKESTTCAINTCKTQLIRVIKSLSPQRFQVNLHLGFEDPAVMGEVMAVWGMLYPFHLGRVDIVPEFEQAILEGDILLKGKISLYVYIKVAMILFFDKNIKQLIKQLKQSV